MVWARSACGLLRNRDIIITTRYNSMSPSTHSILFALATLSIVYSSAQAPTEAYPPGVTGKFPATPLISKGFAYPTGIPQKADTDVGLLRGSQFGYNQCNTTTEGPESNCQTAVINSIDGASQVTCLICLVHSVIQTFVYGPLQSQARLLLTRRVRWLHGAQGPAMEHVLFLSMPSRVFNSSRLQTMSKWLASLTSD